MNFLTRQNLNRKRRSCPAWEQVELPAGMMSELGEAKNADKSDRSTCCDSSFWTPFVKFIGLPCSLICFLLFICQTSAFAQTTIEEGGLDDGDYINCANYAQFGKIKEHIKAQISVYVKNRINGTIKENSLSQNQDCPCHNLLHHYSLCEGSLPCDICGALSGGVVKDLQPLNSSLSRAPLNSNSRHLKSYPYYLTLFHSLSDDDFLFIPTSHGIGAGVAASFGKDRVTFVAPKTGPPLKN